MIKDNHHLYTFLIYVSWYFSSQTYNFLISLTSSPQAFHNPYLDYHVLQVSVNYPINLYTERVYQLYMERQ